MRQSHILYSLLTMTKTVGKGNAKRREWATELLINCTLNVSYVLSSP